MRYGSERSYKKNIASEMSLAKYFERKHWFWVNANAIFAVVRIQRYVAYFRQQALRASEYTDGPLEYTLIS